jgi:hypothetical protein
MKKFYAATFKRTQILVQSALLVFTIIALSSCKKQQVDTSTYAAITFFNASPSFSTYDIYLNDSRINSTAIPFGGAISYSQRVSGNYTVKYTISGRPESALTKSISLSPNTYYSYFLINTSSNLDGLLVTDDLSATSTTNAYVRFINLSPDSPAQDLVINGGATITTSKAYKAVSTYSSLAAGKYTFDIKETGGAVKASLTDVTLSAGAYYTIISKGLKTPGSLDQPLGAQLISSR